MLRKLAYLSLASALSLSSVAAYFSVIGMTSLFGGAFWAIIIMTGVMEVNKIVGTTLLHTHWAWIHGWIKWFMLIAVVVLMLITSMGIFGMLSRAHIDQQLAIAGPASQQLAVLNAKIIPLDEQIKDLKEEVDRGDKVTDTFLEQKKGTGAKNAIKDGKKDRENLKAELAKKQLERSELIPEEQRLKFEVKKIKNEIGPLVYLANIIYGEEANESQLEKAVAWLIIILVLCFDPLALCMTLASLDALGHHVRVAEDKAIEDERKAKIAATRRPKLQVKQDAFVPDDPEFLTKFGLTDVEPLRGPETEGPAPSEADEAGELPEVAAGAVAVPVPDPKPTKVKKPKKPKAAKPVKPKKLRDITPEPVLDEDEELLESILERHEPQPESDEGLVIESDDGIALENDSFILSEPESPLSGGNNIHAPFPQSPQPAEPVRRPGIVEIDEENIHRMT